MTNTNLEKNRLMEEHFHHPHDTEISEALINMALGEVFNQNNEYSNPQFKIKKNSQKSMIEPIKPTIEPIITKVNNGNFCFEIGINKLKNLVYDCYKNIEKKLTNTIFDNQLKCFFLNIKNNNLSIIVNNNEYVKFQTIQSIEVKGHNDGWAYINAKQLRDFLTNFKNSKEIVKLNIENNKLNILTGNINYSIDCFKEFEHEYKSITFEIEKGDYLTKHITTINIKDLQRLFYAPSLCLGKDESRPAMLGIDMKFLKDKIISCGTDAHRLATNNLQIKNNVDNEIRVVMPPILINNILRLKDNKNNINISLITDKWNNNNIGLSFENNDIGIYSNCIDEKFPSYESVIPKKETLSKSVNVNLNELTNAVEFIRNSTKSLSNGDKYHFQDGIKFSFKNDKLLLTYWNNSDDNNVNIEQIVNINSTNTDDLDGIALDPKYLLSALKGIIPKSDNNIFMHFTTHNKPVIFTNTGNYNMYDISLAMPLRMHD